MGDAAPIDVTSSGLVEVDPATNAIVRTIAIGPSLAVVEAGGALSVTSYDANTLTRLRPWTTRHCIGDASSV